MCKNLRITEELIFTHSGTYTIYKLGKEGKWFKNTVWVGIRVQIPNLQWGWLGSTVPDLQSQENCSRWLFPRVVSRKCTSSKRKLPQLHEGRTHLSPPNSFFRRFTIASFKYIWKPYFASRVIIKYRTTCPPTAYEIWRRESTGD